MGEQVECFSGEENIPQALSRSEIQALSISEEYPTGIDLPNFSRYEDFIESDFFARYYYLGEDNISFHPDSHFLQNYSLDPSAIFVERTQRILTILGYLDVESFSGDNCGRFPEVDNCEREFLWRYFGVFGPQTDSAIRRFQSHYSLPVDGIVGTQTKNSFYHVVYHRFHNSHRMVCTEETKQEIKNINMQ